MGANSSKSQRIGYHVVGDDSGEPIHLVYKKNGAKTYGLPTKDPKYKKRMVVKDIFSGIWSSTLPEGDKPKTRMGQAYVYDSLNDRIVIAYGTDSNGMLLNDCWSYDIREGHWTCLNWNAGTPRTNPGAVLWHRMMVIFGGAGLANTFFNDIHAIDIDTGNMITVDVVGNSPEARMNALMFSDSSNIYMWSGMSEKVLNDAYLFNLEERKWIPMDVDQSGRAAATVTTSNDPFSFFVFGSSKIGLLNFDTLTHQLKIVKCFGSQPPTGLSKVSMCVADEFLFLIGGERNAPYTYVFALDLETKIWFAFHVEPDNKTLSLDDGKVSREGLFLLPRDHSAAMVYSPNLRSLISVMGSKMESPPPIYTIYIGQALSALHLKNDMLNILHQSY